MVVERASAGSSLIDVLDRVLDKGIVIDAWVRLSLVGIDLLTVEARIVVASIATYLQYSAVAPDTSTAFRPSGGANAMLGGRRVPPPSRRPSTLRARRLSAPPPSAA